MTHRYQSVWVSRDHRDTLLECLAHLGVDPIVVTIGGRRIVRVTARQITYINIRVPQVNIRDLTYQESQLLAGHRRQLLGAGFS